MFVVLQRCLRGASLRLLWNLCQAPGPHDFTFDNEVEPANPNHTDPNQSNNTVQEDVTVECIVPVAINIHPGSFKNPINIKSRGVIPVAVLTTSAGE